MKRYQSTALRSASWQRFAVAEKLISMPSTELSSILHSLLPLDIVVRRLVWEILEVVCTISLHTSAGGECACLIPNTNDPDGQILHDEDNALDEGRVKLTAD